MGDELRDLILKEISGGIPVDVSISKKHIEIAEEALNKNDFELALMHFEAARRLDSSFDSSKIMLTHIKWGDELISRRDVCYIDEAIGHYEAALCISEGNARKKLQMAQMEKEFQVRVREGVPDIIRGVSPKMSSKEIQDKAYVDFNNFNIMDEYFPEVKSLEGKIIEYINSVLDRRRGEYRNNYPGFDFNNGEIIRGIMGRRDKGSKSYEVGIPRVELRPYSLNGWDLYGNLNLDEEIFKSEILNLRTEDRIVQEIKKSDSGKIYYAGNYVVPITLNQRHHIEMPFRIPFGYKNYGLLNDKLFFDFEISGGIDFIYNAYSGALMGKNIQRLRLAGKSSYWGGVQAKEPSFQFWEDVESYAWKGVVAGCLPGLACAACITTSGMGGEDAALNTAAVFTSIGGIGGAITGAVAYSNRFYSDIKEIQKKWFD